ncbi:MAG: hypothetical protein ABEK17_02645 [Candidatus Aenigmatarchaeota archaeon]
MKKGAVKWFVAIGGISLILLLMIAMPRFQASKEIKTSESVSRTFSIIHSYERAKVSNQKTFQSLLAKNLIELGKYGGGFDWTKNPPNKTELLDELRKNLRNDVSINGDLPNFFFKVNGKKGGVKTTIDNLDSLVVDYKNYPGTKKKAMINVTIEDFGYLETNSLKDINLTSKYTLVEDLPVRYFEIHDIISEYNSTLHNKLKEKNNGDIEKIIERTMKELNERIEKDNYQVYTRYNGKGKLNLTVSDNENNVSYSDGYRNYLFNITLNATTVPDVCIDVPIDCKRGGKCPLNFFSQKPKEVQSYEWIIESGAICNNAGNSQRKFQSGDVIPNAERIICNIQNKGEVLIKLIAKGKYEDGYAILKIDEGEQNLKEDNIEC